MGFLDKLSKVATSINNTAKENTNKIAGNDYRQIYFQRHPDRYQKCNNCKRELDREVNANSHPNGIQIDHIIPQSLGGTNIITNLQPLCPQCNKEKGNRINYLRELGHSKDAIIREIKKGW